MLPLRRYGIKAKVGLTRDKLHVEVNQGSKNKNLEKSKQKKNHTKDRYFPKARTIPTGGPSKLDGTRLWQVGGKNGWQINPWSDGAR